VAQAGVVYRDAGASTYPDLGGLTPSLTILKQGASMQTRLVVESINANNMGT
jgi:hypothetical protein